MKPSDILSIAKSTLILLFYRRPKIFNHVEIIAPQHVRTFAYAILHALKENNISSGIFDPQKNGSWNSSTLYIVICPQHFKTLPVNRIYLQMEQHSANQFFNFRHIIDMKASIAVFDYSKENIKIISSKFDFYKKTTWIPVAAKSNQSIESISATKIYDLAFYGLINDRRSKIIKDLSRSFKIKIIQNKYGAELQKELIDCKFILNIHFYESCILETPRITESLWYGIPVISEAGHDQEDYPWLNGCVFFSDLSTDEIRKIINRPPDPKSIQIANNIGIKNLEEHLVKKIKNKIDLGNNHGS